MPPPFIARYLEVRPEIQVLPEPDDRRIDRLAESADLVIRIGPLAPSGLSPAGDGAGAADLCQPALQREARPAVSLDWGGHDVVGRIDRVTRWTFRKPDGGTRPSQVGTTLRRTG